MQRATQKEPLYRKVNRTAHMMSARCGGDFADRRNSKASKSTDTARLPMHAKDRHGLDYTPLFRFLLSKVGQPWTAVHSEAVARLDREEPIEWLVALKEEDRQDTVRVGESSVYSGLYVDEQGLLQKVNPSLDASSMRRWCACCTHTFNGKPFGLPYEPTA